MTVLAHPTGHTLRPPECVNLHGTDTGRDHLSHTSIGTFLACQQKFDFHYEQRLAQAITPQPLAMGRAFAHALEHGNPDMGDEYLRREAAEASERAAGNPWIVAPGQEDVDIQAVTVCEAARCYLTAYGSHETREVEMRARIRNPARGGRYSQTHDLLGRLDALSTDGRVLFEDKLVGQIPRANFAQRVRLDRQVTIGCYLVWRTTGVEVSEIRYRMTLKPAIKRREGRATKDGGRSGAETHDQFLARIAEEYATRPDHYLAEETAHRDAGDFLRLERELWRWAEQIRESRRDGTWPRNTGQCHERGGCSFIALCAGEPGAEHQFVTRPEREATPAVAAVAPSVRESSHKEAA